MKISQYKNLITILVSCITILACDSIPKVGVIKNMANGITSMYKNIIPEEVIKIMNGEVFDHNQVPLGESFQVVSNKIKGLVVKDEKVSIGCELTVSDKTGNILLNVPDLFEENGILSKDSADFLRCIVNTGSPMKWQEFYDIEIRYWDKYGEGELTNKLEIEIIDEP